MDEKNKNDVEDETKDHKTETTKVGNRNEDDEITEDKENKITGLRNINGDDGSTGVRKEKRKRFKNQDMVNMIMGNQNLPERHAKEHRKAFKAAEKDDVATIFENNLTQCNLKQGLEMHEK